MQYEPISKIWLLNTNLELSYTHTILFENKEKQQEFFLDSSKIIKDLSNTKSVYQRENNVVNVPFNRDDILNVNYLIYINPNFANKYYYCFVNSIEYINQNMSAINISTDIFQTYFFDVDFKSALVERFIPSKEDDLVGAFTYPENLEIGDPQINKIDMSADTSYLNPVYVLAVNGYWNGSSWEATFPKGCTINGIPQAMSYIFASSVADINDWISILNSSGMGDRIISFFSVPSVAFNMLNNKFYRLWNSTRMTVFSDDLKTMQTQGVDITLHRPDTFYDNMTGDTFTPKNKKLFTYPFAYLVNQPIGSQPKIFRYENFVYSESTDELQFKLYSEITPNARVLFVPFAYKIDSNFNFSESNESIDYPTLSYATDIFNSWLVKNKDIMTLQQINRDNLYDLENTNIDVNKAYQQANNQLNYFSNSANNLVAGVSGNISSIRDQVINYSNALLSESLINYQSEYSRKMNSINYNYQTALQLQQIRKESLTPPNVQQGGSSIAISNSLINQEIFVHYSIKVEYAKRIDEYFSRFGYKVNDFMNLQDTFNTRNNWNYVKTSHCIITGNVPQEVLESMMDIFNSGITLWHNPSTYLDFSQNNE